MTKARVALLALGFLSSSVIAPAVQADELTIDSADTSNEILQNADELAAEMGLDVFETSEFSEETQAWTALDWDRRRNPGDGHRSRRPRPPNHQPPGPPPYDPYPHQPYPPQPYPPAPYPAPRARYECGSQDLRGWDYWERSQDPRTAQYEAHRTCTYRSRGPCRDLGCRRY